VPSMLTCVYAVQGGSLSEMWLAELVLTFLIGLFVCFCYISSESTPLVGTLSVFSCDCMH